MDIFEAGVGVIETRPGTSQYFIRVFRVEGGVKKHFADVYGDSAGEAIRNADAVANGLNVVWQKE